MGWINTLTISKSQGGLGRPIRWRKRDYKSRY